MIFWSVIYFIGLLVTTAIAGILNRNRSIPDDEASLIAWMCFLWPLCWALVIIAGIPLLTFAFFKGELDDEIAQLKKNIAAAWNSIGD